MYCISYGFYVLSSYIVSHLGTRYAFLLSMVPYIIFNALCATLELGHSILLLSLFSGMSAGLFWYPYHTRLIRHSNVHKFGKQLATLRFIEISVSSLGPIIGALLLYLNHTVLFIGGAVALVCSIFMQVRQTNEKIPCPFVHTSHSPRYMCEGVLNACSTIWPLLLFVTGIRLLVIGSLYTVIRLIDIGISFFLGKKLENVHKLSRIGAYFQSISYVVRALFVYPLFMTISTLIAELGASLMYIFFSKEWMSQARLHGMGIILFRERFLLVGRLFVFICCGVVLFFTHDVALSVSSGLLLGGCSSLFLARTL
jgi:MFS family permease